MRILGWPALAKFMAVLHYTYLWANLSITYAYETESLALVEATDLSI